MKTLAYVRVTAASQSEDAQRHKIAEAYHIERWFKDEELGGSTCSSELPGFIELCKLARKGDTVIVSSIECLGITAIELYRALQALRARGVGVMAVQGRFDFSSPTGKALFRMVASIAQANDTVRGSRRKGSVR
ncbi:recombinase family protein [Pseudomonas aeruginosa]|uniref:recombinase family protein n=1 Tax=Pseudomonas aeruginosa TaxID=287 RepID=UPI0013793352|nr:recombinase family protein [Pseudomonas aeruginosa]MBI8516372.1 recombinase family protein [Pseudomonas aeruginosa]MBI8533896.1 recombinase family protein [Pseudomonas aeruginosa]NRS76372.1 recombinase family protein [Pseudomonas aeruginosa]HBP0837921.1 recombinase family protein [Pseudomonas aeruginosa]